MSKNGEQHVNTITSRMQVIKQRPQNRGRKLDRQEDDEEKEAKDVESRYAVFGKRKG